MQPDSLARPTWAEIDLDNLARNYLAVRKFAGDVACMAVVKANAYGHGAVECSRRLEAKGVDWFGVATVEEGIELRDASIERPILVLGGFWPGQIELALSKRLTPVVSTLEQAHAIDRIAEHRGEIATIHVKLDTGMGRLGFRYDDAFETARQIAQLDHVSVEGLMTHFAAADDMASGFTELQSARFNEAAAAFRSNGITPRYLDLANSPGAVAHPQTRADMIRLGGVLYGLGGDVLPKEVAKPALFPVMAVRSQIALIKEIKAGEPVGYSRIWTAERHSRVAAIPIGYYDGFRRGLSESADVLIRGERAPVVGRISMDWTTIDVTVIPDAAVGDVVTMIGSDGQDEIKAEDLAARLDTISYEVTCGISARVSRIYK